MNAHVSTVTRNLPKVTMFARMSMNVLVPMILPITVTIELIALILMVPLISLVTLEQLVMVWFANKSMSVTAKITAIPTPPVPISTLITCAHVTLVSAVMVSLPVLAVLISMNVLMVPLYAPTTPPVLIMMVVMIVTVMLVTKN